MKLAADWRWEFRGSVQSYKETINLFEALQKPEKLRCKAETMRELERGSEETLDISRNSEPVKTDSSSYRHILSPLIPGVFWER